MKFVQRVVTFDGQVHDDRRAATKHLDRLYSDAITRIAHQLTDLRYRDVAPYLDANLDKFLELKKIKDDMTMTHDADEE